MPWWWKSGHGFGRCAACPGSSRDRFTAGVTDTVEVVQSQEAVASAHEQYISSLYSYNFAKISLARAIGVAENGVREYFKEK